jgi:scyllo-inositol 2-dehydrogenase (NADP+)
MDAVPVGLVGFGLAGRDFHAPFIEATDGLELVAVVTSRSEEVAARHPRAEVLRAAAALWNRCELVVIAAPNRVHASLAREAIAAGVAVIVDKPLAVTAAEAAGVVSRARDAGVPLSAFHNRRWDDDFLTVRRLLAQGALGEVVRVESRFERFRPDVSGERWRESPDPADGGGTLLDLGSHLVDQARVLLGPVLRVYAEVGRRRPGAAVEDDAFLALEHPDGVGSHLRMGAAAPLHGERFAVTGLRAGFLTEGMDPQEQALRAGATPGEPGFAGAPRAGRLVGADGARAVALERGDYGAFYRAVPEWLRDGAPPPVDPEDAVAVLRVIEAARTSAAERRVVDEPEGAP